MPREIIAVKIPIEVNEPLNWRQKEAIARRWREKFAGVIEEMQETQRQEALKDAQVRAASKLLQLKNIPEVFARFRAQPHLRARFVEREIAILRHERSIWASEPDIVQSIDDALTLLVEEERKYRAAYKKKTEEHSE